MTFAAKNFFALMSALLGDGCVGTPIVAKAGAGTYFTQGSVMTALFDRYPNGGGEMLLALALVDHASDEGTRVYPHVKVLAEKTRQSERTVQCQLRRMKKSVGCSWPALEMVAEVWPRSTEFRAIG